MSLTMLLTAVLAGFPVVFMPSYISDGGSFARPLTPEDEKECLRLIDVKLPLPAYDYCLKCSHTFNLLDARGAISITERAGYIARVRALASGVAHLYAAQREAMGYPMLKKG